MTRWIAFGAVLLFGPAGSLYGGPGVTKGLNRFSASIYEQLAKSGGRNLVVSPYSIAGALSMTLPGARGRTADEISKVLGQAAADPEYQAAFAGLIGEIGRSANVGGNELLTANGLWVQKDFPILPDFGATLRSLYHAEAAPVDFLGALEPARAEINAWTERKTKGKIRDLFPAGALDGRTRLVLSSAIYFYGRWERAFRTSATRPESFTLPSGGSQQTDFMHQTGRFGYAETAAGQMLEMRYAGTGLAFDILLPKKGADIGTMEVNLDPEKLALWAGSLEPRTVDVAIPRFRVESNFPLSGTLAKLGMPSAFSGAADFSGIDDRRDLHLSYVIHKAYIDVAEEGTEAAAATGAAVALISAQISPPALVFRADHPFVFLIRDTRSGLVLFTGRLVNPKD